MYRVIANDEQGKTVSISGFVSEERARQWWDDQLADGGPWRLVGFARQITAREAEMEWLRLGQGLAARDAVIQDA